MLLTEQLAALPASDWDAFFSAEAQKPYFAALDTFVTDAARTRTVYPAAGNIFAAFRACPAAAVRVIILGQDPYHEPGQAMGLAFSVPNTCPAPPSLRNIFKELASDTGLVPLHTDLTLWARRGVLLLNTVLTVEQGAANAHAGHGWEEFTRAALTYAAQCANTPLAAVLWGKPAQRCAPIFSAAAAHRPVLVLESAHPSPLSAYRGFFGSAPFTRINAFLQENGEDPIDWTL